MPITLVEIHSLLSLAESEVVWGYQEPGIRIRPGYSLLHSHGLKGGPAYLDEIECTPITATSGSLLKS